MKREYNTILDDADSANCSNFAPCFPGNISQGDQYLKANC